MTVDRVFIDTNVFDELFADGPAAADIAFIVEHLKRKTILGYTSPKTLMDVYYLIHTEKGWHEANKRIRQIYSLVEITPQTQKEVRESLAYNWSDFEDAMQMASAISQGVDKIITLDRKFRNKDNAFIWTPADLKSYLIMNSTK
ncbi:type II toxin-antitoxin system VapC family toxin [Cyclobacterium jeungdonense]|uniref:PIN domain-containing protein n=1 Tax=Cyclobacterium jeungdonense TaxID=708087 RepID=A0ABT8C735_9BACT|nr:PIN domain-containing protein [Cyclobacterium jeungdonense]MDN3687540.1 PIN domain-containing protein [Cyclobacterium jeungdonense]